MNLNVTAKLKNLANFEITQAKILSLRNSVVLVAAKKVRDSTTCLHEKVGIKKDILKSAVTSNKSYLQSVHGG